jgi:hypothetical protein
MSKRIAVFQSNYIPWKGFFDLIRSVDEFVLDDDVQFTKQSWRNRNRIKSPEGLQWLTIPVHTNFPDKIGDVRIADNAWPAKHWRAIESSYRRAPAFDVFGPYLHELYLTARHERLSAVNEHFLRGICDWMGIATPLLRSIDMPVEGERNERLIAICRSLDADRLLNGPSAREHMDETKIVRAGIQVEYEDYEGYQAYPQLHGVFEHAVSIVDLLLHCGRDFERFLRTF